MRYDAFISYRHGELDGLVAEHLHRMLETFRVPAAIARKTGKKRIRRVFRDREELPTASNLSDSIEEALQESEFLILICSKRTCQSRWVLREVDRFIELGRRDKIVTLLIDGEPDESFPDQIRWRKTDDGLEAVEPLAADIRADTPKKSLALLKAELLRVLAPILGCAYDDLRQRHKERAARRLLAGVSLVLAVSLAFGAVTFTQYLRVTEQMRMKLYNQSFVLAEYSAAALERGDPVTAALLALEGLPKNMEAPERPYVPEAEVALTNALGAYDYRETFVPHRSRDFSATVSALTLSPDERHLAVLLEDSTLALMDTADGAVIRTFTTFAGVKLGVVFPAPDVMVYTAPEGLTAVDISSGTVLWRTEAAGGVVISADASTIAAACDGHILLLDASGKEKRRFDTGGRSLHSDRYSLNDRYNCLELSEDGSLLAVAFTDATFSVFNAADGTETRLLTDSGFVTCRFTPEYLTCAWLPLAKDDDSIKSLSGKYRMAALDRKTLTRAWEQEAYGSARVLSLGNEVAFINYKWLAVFTPGDWRETLLTFFGEEVIAAREKSGLILTGYQKNRFNFRLARPAANTPDWPAGIEAANYQGPPYSNRLALGRRFAAGASMGGETVLLFRWNEKAAVFTYDYPDIVGARGNADGTRLYAYDFTKFRMVDARSGQAVLTLPFDDVDAVWNVRRMAAPLSGNYLRSYEGRCSLYSAVDGALLFQKDGLGCTLTDAGINMRLDGELLLVDPDTGRETARYAVPDGGMLVYGQWRVLVGSGGRSFSVGRGEAGPLRQYPDAVFKGARVLGDDLLLFLAAGGDIRCHSARDGRELFRVKEPAVPYGVSLPKDLHLVIVDTPRAPLAAYTLPEGTPIPALTRKDYLFKEIYKLPGTGYLLAVYIDRLGSGTSGLLLREGTFQAVATIPNSEGNLGGELVLLNNKRNLKAVPWYTSEQIRAMAKALVAGQSLTPEQRQRYHVVE